MGAPCNNSLPQESRCQSLLLKLPFQDAPKAREDPASEAAGAKDADGGGAGGGGGERGPVTWCSGAPKCAHPADVTVREFKSPKLGGNPVRSFMAHPRAAVARQGSPPRYRVGPHQLTRNPAGMARSRGRAGTPTSDGAPGRGHRFPPPWAGSQPQARTPTSGTESDPPHPTARASWADAEGVCPADTHTLRRQGDIYVSSPFPPLNQSPVERDDMSFGYF